jgi:ribosomal protein L7/L12
MNAAGPQRPAQLPPEVTEALRRGRRVEAIKLLRSSSGLDLAQAKRLIDQQQRMQRQTPDKYQSQMQNMIKEDRANTRLLWIAAFLLAALMAWYFLSEAV